MLIVIRNPQTGERLCKREYPEEFTPVRALDEVSGQLDLAAAYINYTDSWFEGMRILTINTPAGFSGSLKVEWDTALYTMLCCLQGGVKCKGRGLDITLAANQYFVKYAAAGPTVYDLTDSPKCVCIQFTEKCVERLTRNEDFPVKHSILHSRITPAMRMILYSLGEYTQSTPVRRIFLETGVLQLLMMQLELLSSQKREKGFLKNHDVERIQYVKLLIEENIRNPGTLIELAHKAGLNDFKLKKGFKELYNTTVFGYLHELRMNRARQLLTEEKKSVSEVSHEVGYKNPHHFSSAFKKKFGILPGQLNK